MESENDNKEIKKTFLEGFSKGDPGEEKLLNRILEEPQKWQVNDSEDLNEVLQKVHRKIDENDENKQSGWRYLKFAATIVFVLGMIFWATQYKYDDAIIFVTQKGQKKNIQLPDGSKIIMAGNSMVSYSGKKWSKERVVHLKGKAYFDVNRGGQFTVISNSGSVEVLGTTFTVVDREKTYSVVCYSGKVGVRSGDEEVLIERGSGVQLISNKLAIRNADVTKGKNWIEDTHYYENIALHDLVVELSDFYDVDIILKTSENRYFTGYIYFDQSFEGNMERLSKVLKLNYSVSNQGIEINAKEK